MAPRRWLRKSVPEASLVKKRALSPIKTANPGPSSTYRQTKRTTSTSNLESDKSAVSSSKAAEVDDEDERLSEAPSSSAVNEQSGYEDEDDSAEVPSSSSEDEESVYTSDDEVPARKKQKRRSGPVAKSNPQSAAIGSMATVGEKGKELWRPGVSAGLGPGMQVVIDKPKARPAGKIQYRDETIHPNTMLFLEELAQNNDREWLKMHDPNYRTALQDFNSFVESLQKRLMDIDETIPELPVKDIIFRIYRDVRFSPDQTPYKTHFSAAWSRTGRKGPYAAYYVQIKPGGSFVGGGLWMPEAQPLAALRRDIDRKPHKIKDVLVHPRIRKEFFGLSSADKKKAVKAFCEQNSENALKTKPKGQGVYPIQISISLKNCLTMFEELCQRCGAAAFGGQAKPEHGIYFKVNLYQHASIISKWLWTSNNGSAFVESFGRAPFFEGMEQQ